MKTVASRMEERGLDALQAIRDNRRAFQDQNATKRQRWIRANSYFYDRLKKLLRFIVGTRRRVLDVRCMTGDILSAVEPSYGVGVEIGCVMVEQARQMHPDLHFVQSDPEFLNLGEKFDCIIFNHIFDTVDILSAFNRAHAHCDQDSIFIIINYNPLWQPILELASKLGLRARFVEPNWVTADDIRGFLKLASFRPLREYRFLLFPKWIPLISTLLNDFIGRLPVVRRLCLMQVIVARPTRKPSNPQNISVSVVIPCRNEEGNVASAAERIPPMGGWTEIIFCDDKSVDGTAAEVARMQRVFPGKNIRLIEGPGICKAENVWTGFREARGDVLMILDADLSVMPEELPMFFRAMVNGTGEFVNGSRLVYPMQKQAMKFTNMIGNKVFGLIFSFLLNQPIKDTLCGTKCLWRKDWRRIEEGLGSLGIKDLWGDYELLFGAYRLNLEIMEVPVHYQERIFGVTKMSKVFSNGVRMLGICWHAWFRVGG